MKKLFSVFVFSLCAVVLPFVTGCGPSEEPSTEDLQDAANEVPDPVDESEEGGQGDPGSGEGE